ncbi:MAG: transcriptional repressor LexA [Bacillota bacterium]
MKQLTNRQKEVLNFIREEVVNKNYPPSVREICQAMNLSSSSTVHSHLKALQKKGYIKRDPTKPRAIALTHPALADKSWQQAKLVPLVGQVTAGVPVLAEENIESYMHIPSEIVKNDTVFLLRIQGDSMKDAGILPHDLVIVRQQPAAENGEIVVALLEDEATVKRFYREKDYVRLQPENPAYQPIMAKNVVILGKVIGLLRTWE